MTRNASRRDVESVCRAVGGTVERVDGRWLIIGDAYEMSAAWNGIVRRTSLWVEIVNTEALAVYREVTSR